MHDRRVFELFQQAAGLSWSWESPETSSARSERPRRKRDDKAADGFNLVLDGNTTPLEAFAKRGKIALVRTSDFRICCLVERSGDDFAHRELWKDTRYLAA